jgi:hypothetical protein
VLLVSREERVSGNSAVVTTRAEQDHEITALTVTCWARDVHAAEVDHSLDMPTVRPPDGCPPYRDAELLFPFPSQVDIRPVDARLPLSGSEVPELTAWVRLRSGAHVDTAVALVMLDVLAPAAYAAWRMPAVMPTLELTAHLLVDLDAEPVEGLGPRAATPLVHRFWRQCGRMRRVVQRRSTCCPSASAAPCTSRAMRATGRDTARGTATVTDLGLAFRGCTTPAMSRRWSCHFSTSTASPPNYSRPIAAVATGWSPPNPDKARAQGRRAHPAKQTGPALGHDDGGHPWRVRLRRRRAQQLIRSGTGGTAIDPRKAPSLDLSRS